MGVARRLCVLGLAALIWGCGPVKLSGPSESNSPSQNQTDKFPGETGVNGITGGHFDLDTATQIYSVNKATTNHHVHEYDKVHQTTTVDFFNLLDAKFDEIQKTIPPGKPFVLHLLNANLSPGGVLQINSSNLPVTAFREGQIYTIGPASSGQLQLSTLKLGFRQDVLANGGLVPTETGCVRSGRPGVNGEYRSGALTIQALEAGAFSYSQNGAAASGLLWEATVFWHWDGGCY